MIDYCIKMPKNEEYEKGHRYPYYSCEILCSINGFNIDKLLNTPFDNNKSFDSEKNISDNNKNNDQEKKNR